MANIIEAKKEVADEILSLLTPHNSLQLGGHLGYGVNTLGADLLPQASEAIKVWVQKNDPNKLIATLMTANALGATSDSETDALIGKIKKIDKKEIK